MKTTRGLQVTGIAGAALMACPGWAIELDTGNPDWSIRFDNTVKSSLIYRTESADPALVNSFSASGAPQALNFNAGDDNFRNRGFVSKRIDLLSEFDAVYKKDVGMRLSTAAWYDAAYRGSTAAADPVNGQTPSNEFPADTRKLAGRKAELLDAFVFGDWALGEGRQLTARLGRHALVYGESVFFGENGIARAQGPTDIFKLLSSPNAQFKEIIRPVPQVSTQLQLSPGLSMGAYYQFRWEADRLPPSGSYFSTVNTPWGSSQPELIGIPAGPIAGNYVLTPSGDRKPRDSGQFGAQLKWRVDDVDLGFYAARYHDKGGQFYGRLNLADPAASNWYYAFPENVKTAGVSASRTVGDFNFAGEASVRWDMPLRSVNMVYPGVAPEPSPATGQTAHLNFSWLASLPPSFLARESSLIGEIAWNHVLKKNDPDGELDAGRTRSATALQVVFSPSYRQVLPGLDINVPVGLRYTLDGYSSVTAWDASHNGLATIGIEGNYLGEWQFTATYTHFIGNAVPFVDFAKNNTYAHGNSMADRNNIAVSLRRTF